VPRDFDLVEQTLSRSAYRALVCDGVFSQALGVLTGGALLVGCALALGASPAYIGLLSAIPFFAQVAHIPAVVLIERVRRRKAICVAVTLAARAMLVPLAIVPLLADRNVALGLLLLCFAVVTPLGAVGGCAWMSWTCDLVPRARLGEIFSRRQLCANLAAMAAGLAGAGLVDFWPRYFPEWRLGGYAAAFTLATLAAMASTWFLTRMPDVPMAPVKPPPLATLFARPFADRNFRRVMIFLGSWTFAVNLALPFFTVYLVRDLGTGLTAPVLLAVVGQLANIVSLPWWGRLSDRRSNKAVIAICGPLLLAAILGWVLAAEPAPHALTLPLLFLVQTVMGAAGAGLDLACGNLAFKTAPQGEATVYLGTNGLVKSLCGGFAPLAGGFLAQSLTGVSARPLTVVFLAACAAGILALTRIAGVAEHGEAVLPRRFFRYRRPLPSANSKGEPWANSESVSR
jgi:MFS family permease